MNRTLFFTTAAAVAVVLAHPLQAKPKESKNEDGKPASVQSSVRVSKPSQPLMVKGSTQFKHEMSKPAPTVAFGGSVPKNFSGNASLQDRRRFGNSVSSSSFSRSDFRSARPSVEVFRDWDRRQTHYWNNHRYRWYDNDWVIIDGGYEAPYYYESAPVPLEYAASDDLASAVQEELGRRGYDPGGVDGVIGPQTRNAIAAFQNDRGLPVTGRIDRSLLRALNLQ